MKKVTSFIGESGPPRNGAVGELASFLARMEGAAEVSADHVASATRITTGTTLEDGFDAMPEDEMSLSPDGERPVAPVRRLRGQTSKSRAAIFLIITGAACLVASGTADDLVYSRTNLAANAPPTGIAPRERAASRSASSPSLTSRALIQDQSVAYTSGAAPRPARDGAPASARDGTGPSSIVDKPDLSQVEVPPSTSKAMPAQRQAIEPPAGADQPTKSASVTPQSSMPLPPLQSSSLPSPPPKQSYVAPNPFPLPTTGEQPSAVSSSSNVMIFVRRADRLIELGDISGARLLYERAAGLGSAAAAFSMGRTFDPVFLSASHASIPPDEVKSAEWYRRAIALGSGEAAASLRLLDHRVSR